MILVTGGTGLVGSHLLVRLCENQHQIRATYRTKESISKCQNVFEIQGKSALFLNIEWVYADIEDYFSVKDALQGIDYVYHLAAVVSFDAKRSNEMMKANIEGTANVVNASLEQGIKKLCYVSSVAALGEYEGNKCTDEEALWQKNEFTSDYSISKYYAENEVWRASEEGLNSVIVNPATIIGFGDWTESSSTIIRKVAKGLRFYPPGTNGFVGVDDVVKAIILLMESSISHERFILVSENLSFKTILSTIAKGLNKKAPSIKVSKSIANLLQYLDQLRAFLFGSPLTLTKQTIQTSFSDRCYSSEKLKKALANFKFEPMEESILKACKLYSKESD